MDLGIKGRRAIVTGGGSGIGYETAREFLQEGVRVAICGRNEAKLNMAREQLAQKTGGEIHTVQADMTNEADIVQTQGMGDMQRLLDRIAAGSPTEAALHDVLRDDYGDLMQATAEYLKKTYGR